MPQTLDPEPEALDLHSLNALKGVILYRGLHRGVLCGAIRGHTRSLDLGFRGWHLGLKFFCRLIRSGSIWGSWGLCSQFWSSQRSSPLLETAKWWLNNSPAKCV